MTIKELYADLVEAYADANLNQVTGHLISLYKNKHYSKIRKIANKISRYVSFAEEEKDAKLFSQLIMLYHPDKGGHIRKEINAIYEQNDLASLQKYAHILKLQEIDTEVSTTVDADIGYSEEYTWDNSSGDGFVFTDEAGEESAEYAEDFERSFYNLIKLREYGRVDEEFPTYYLEDFEAFEMAYSGLESLDGVEFCKHVKVLDVSGNAISDLENLWNLEHLEELYLANNQIGYIDALSNLTHLKTLDLSGNQIDDISPLMALEELEYVNLMGNPVPARQIAQLQEKDVIVMV